TFINTDKVNDFSNLMRQKMMNMMKPILFVNTTTLPEGPYYKLVVKNENSEVKKRLEGLGFLTREPKWGNYLMKCSEHNLRLLTDQVSDIAAVNTRYLDKKPIKTAG